MSMDINAPLFRQLDRLENIDPSDTDALKAEIERAKAVKDIAETIIDSGHLTADVIKLKHQLGATATIPKGLLYWEDESGRTKRSSGFARTMPRNTSRICSTNLRSVSGGARPPARSLKRPISSGSGTRAKRRQTP